MPGNRAQPPIPSPCAHGFGRLQRPAAGEDRQAAEEHPFRLGQQVVTPVDRRPQPLLAGQGRPAPARQQPEAVVQARGNLLGRQQADPRRRQFNRQRDAIQPGTELHDGGRVRAGNGEAGLDRLSALGEQAHRLGLPHLLQVQAALHGWHGQRGHPPGGFAGDAQRLAAGDQEPNRRTLPEHNIGERGTGADEVLAVVQHQQQVLVGQPGGKRLDKGLTGLIAHIDRPCHGRHHQCRVRQHRQLRQPDAVRVGRLHLGRHRQGQPRLAHPARADQGQQPGAPKQLLDLSAFPRPADEAGQGQGQGVRQRRRMGSNVN